MSELSFTNSEKNVLAEYIFSHQHDVLIKSDAIEAINVLERYNLIENASQFISDIENQVSRTADKILRIIKDKIGMDAITAIMSDYYKGAL